MKPLANQGFPEIPEWSQNNSGTDPAKLVPESQIPLESGTGTNHESGTVRILLSEQASRHLTATGERAFVVASRVMRTEEPETLGRWALHLIPCEIAAANAAVGVALGRTRAVRIKASPATPDQPRRATSDPRVNGGASGGDSPSTYPLLSGKSCPDCVALHSRIQSRKFSISSSLT